MYTKNTLIEIFQRLYNHFGPQHWWPGDSPWEVAVGAVLTQNTNWKNVEKAITNLKSVNTLDFDKISTLPSGLLAEYIRPAGYYNIKAGRLGNLFSLINSDYDGNPEKLFREKTETLREKLLSVKGIGQETADAILLYAAKRPVFVVDTYTYRILSRHELILEDATYDDIQNLFIDSLESDVAHFNEYHALLVCLGKDFCKKRNPLCNNCPLSGVAGISHYQSLQE